MFTTSKKLVLSTLGIMALASAAAYAQAANDAALIVTPQCLLQHVNAPYQTLAQAQSFALISTHQAGVNALIAAKQLERKNLCGGFMDVTLASKRKGLTGSALLNHYLPPAKKPAEKTKHYTMKYHVIVRQLLKQINPQNIWNDLTNLSSRPDRYANSHEGVKAADWIKSQIEGIAKKAGRDDVTAYFVDTGSDYMQPSLVVKMGDSNKSGIVIGGHMDTLSGTWGNMPGADDDGSGSATLMEVARTLLNSGVHFNKPIYFIWYSAEEEGLIGSGYVVEDFLAKNIAVDAVMQLDMTGYEYQNKPTIWLMDDFVSGKLSKFTEKLIGKYVKVPVEHSRCGYACSDHASWNQAGFAAVMPFENQMNFDDPYIHTSEDTMDVLSLDHMTAFAKLGVAFAVELAEPVA